ncbi:unnamed protein product [Blepharisma stoltei]|uniref:Protein kinase domain-containing protein n=1 Tax=Blepharisma stoltei TaxID=1481888 RepID=A0AAU9J3P3_9CILI|nr:unnamed protein product [Blepharisma stoltei]
MDSVFSTFYQDSQQSFWVSTQIKTPKEITPILHTGMLYERKSPIISKEKLCFLTDSALFAAKSSGLKAINLAWRIVEPFTEESQNSIKYGFRILKNSSFKYFYVDSSQDLNIWIKHLSKISIMTGVESDYNIKKQIGKGTFSTVWLAQDLYDNNNKYAIKSIPKALLTRPSTIEALKSEIFTLKTLDHPNVIKLHKIYESNTHVHLVLDYVEGGDLLKRLLEKGPLSEKKASKFAVKLLKLLNYLAQHQIVHRDIKLENILLVSDKKETDFKLTDFGLACISNEELTDNCGSPGYVAPEILRKIPYGLKVDIFSVGVVLFMMLSARAPFSGKSPKDIIAKNKECLLSFHNKCWLQISKEAINTILALTNSNPNLRPNAKSALALAWFSSFKKNKRMMRSFSSTSTNASNSSSYENSPVIKTRPIERKNRLSIDCNKIKLFQEKRGRTNSDTLIHQKSNNSLNKTCLFNKTKHITNKSFFV